MNRSILSLGATALITMAVTSCQGPRQSALPPQAFIPPVAAPSPAAQQSAIGAGLKILPEALNKTPDDGFGAFSGYSGGFLTTADGAPFLDKNGNPVPMSAEYVVFWNANADALGAMQADVSVMKHAILPSALSVQVNAAQGFQGKNAEIIAERAHLARAILDALAPSIRAQYEGEAGLIKVRSDGLVDIITAGGESVTGVLKAATPIGQIADGLSVVLEDGNGVRSAHVVEPKSE